MFLNQLSDIKKNDAAFLDIKINLLKSWLVENFQKITIANYTNILNNKISIIKKLINCLILLIKLRTN